MVLQVTVAPTIVLRVWKKNVMPAGVATAIPAFPDKDAGGSIAGTEKRISIQLFPYWVMKTPSQGRWSCKAPPTDAAATM